MVRWIVLALGAALLGRGTCSCPGWSSPPAPPWATWCRCDFIPGGCAGDAGGRGGTRGRCSGGGSGVHQVRREPTAPQVGRSGAVRGPRATHQGRAGGEGRRAAAGRAAI